MSIPQLISAFRSRPLLLLTFLGMLCVCFFAVMAILCSGIVVDVRL